MNTPISTAIDKWLGSGGRVVASSERAARALTAAFHQTRRAEGKTAWPAPAITTWQSFVRAAWEERTPAERMVLNPAQEEAIWAGLAAESRLTATILEGPRHRLAELATEAHALLCSHAPQALAPARRTGWSAEAGIFSGWLKGFEEQCRAQQLVSPARLALEVIAALDGGPREPLLLMGFDRILPTQRTLLDAWGRWQLAPTAEPASKLIFYAAADPRSEIEACALWCRERLSAEPQARLLVVAPQANLHRGEIERAFERHARGNHAGALYEFTLGVPLDQTGVARSALLLLRWLSGSLSEAEVDWLLASRRCAASEEEATALLTYQRLLRRRNLERMRWPLHEWRSARATSLPSAWIERIGQALALLEPLAERRQSPLEWAALAPRLLEAAGWPGVQALSSAAFQALERWRQALETAGSLGFDGRVMNWTEFLSSVERIVAATLFTAESEEAPIQIAGPAEAAGLSADGLWFLGAGEDAWPPAGTTHPLLPMGLQKETGMPFADPRLDAELAQGMLMRLTASAPEICCSFARRNEKAEARPAKAVIELAGLPSPLPKELVTELASPPATLPVAESAPIPLPPAEVAGGSSVLTAQSQCPFKAFARARLGAQGWEPAQPCLTQAQRGQLLHDALHAIWAGPPRGLHTHADLLAVSDLPGFVRRHVRTAMDRTPANVLATAPRRYLELEEERLCTLLVEWLAYESARLPFTVEATELARPVTIAGLTLNLRLDRLDRLNDHSVLVIDYKSGNAEPASWELPRPDDVQLPLYAGFGLDEGQEVGGLVLAKVRAGKHKFAGRVADAAATLLPGLSGLTSLVKKAFSVELLLDWRECIEGLAKEFLQGEAQAKPNRPLKTCQHCDLGALCRVRESDSAAAEDQEEEDDDE